VGTYTYLLMTEDFSVVQKLGCDKYALDNCILIKATVEAVSTIIQEYFALKVRSHCKISDYVDANKASWAEEEQQRQVRKSRPNKSLPPVMWVVPLWQYLNHQWTILPLQGTEESIAFALALLLGTDTITFHDSRHASYNEFKVFRKDQLVEHYLFGFECGKDSRDDWDIKIEDSEFDTWNYEHRFKSSIRQVAEVELRAAFLARKQDRDNRGFLDVCLKYYRAYIPLVEETPYHYHGEQNSNSQKWDSMVERMDLIVAPSNWSYADWKIPDRVT
jgi:hypothetical protein